MQPPTYREIIQQLLREGFVERVSAGDHRRFSKNGYKVTVRDQGGKHATWRCGRASRGRQGGLNAQGRGDSASSRLHRIDGGFTCCCPQSAF